MTSAAKIASTPFRLIATVLAAALLAGATRAEERAPHSGLEGREYVARMTGVFNGVRVDYEARLEETLITNDDDAPAARFYSTAYLAQSGPDRRVRPVIFIWNGGPSVAAVPLHMTGFGPKRLAPRRLGADAPVRLIDNERTLLDVADLVFVDPAETGFSRILPGGSRDYFYSAQGDAESVAQFIRKWLDAHDRSHSPVFVMGSSYGSIRAAIVAGAMAEAGAPLDGVILLSQGVNLVETTQRRHNLVGYASNLSQLAAVGWFHGLTARPDTTVHDVVDEAYAFAMSDYLVAIAKGRAIPKAEREAIARRLEALTGLAAGEYLTRDLLVNKTDFRRNLLKEKGLVLAANDARDAYREDAPPSGEGSERIEMKALKTHLTSLFGATFPLDAYRFQAPETASWDYGGSSTLDGKPVAPGAVRSVFSDFDWTGELEKAFAANPSFRVFIATGVYDLLTTTGPARMLASNVHFPGDRVESAEYEGGHDFYADEAVFPRLAEDLRSFVNAESAAR
ncbi:S10 family serine carboxypeptidase-like protein [Amphiplicatus metriothermophilus]|uniref:Carboxypeptidase C (Cathepsin A) n=1 Tax=Amphiplicatus metriothermophilus TaxID=1519374 RepID=A0A239PWQ8_9PROT|nr:hypothetical protein [Amphiplicatus metriothermophilus]MBB5519563.1 hypothetical protein [Amphiplicatus metriothermophilus]SNT74127.1 Carboxypeptidase C (cathepsin A) [Amphiplicatus metriothermophilus]